MSRLSFPPYIPFKHLIGGAALARAEKRRTYSFRTLVMHGVMGSVHTQDERRNRNRMTGVSSPVHLPTKVRQIQFARQMGCTIIVRLKDYKPAVMRADAAKDRARPPLRLDIETHGLDALPYAGAHLADIRGRLNVGRSWRDAVVADGEALAKTLLRRDIP